MMRYIPAIPEDIPEVQSLILDHVVTAGGPSLAIERLNVALPLHILTTPKPALRHLELSRCAVDWKAIVTSDLPIRNLLSLNLRSLDPRIPHHSLLEILAASPKLQTVELRSAIADGTRPFSEDLQNSVSLPHLREYTITDSSIAILNHRTHLTLPSTAKISFSTPTVPSDAKGANSCVMRLLSVFGLASPLISMKLEASYQTHSKRVFESLSIDFDSQGITLCLFETRAANFDLFDPLYSLENHTPDIRLQIPSSAVTQKTLFQVLRVLGVKEAKVRMYETQNQVSASLWRAFFRAHPGIDSLYVFGEEIHPICRALESAEPDIKHKPKANPSTTGSTVPDNADEDTGPHRGARTSTFHASSLALPSLQVLILEGVAFDMPIDLANAYQSHSFSSLLTACIDRCNYSIPLPIITVRDSSGFDEEMEMLLGEVVGVDLVKWDGIDTRDDEYDGDFFDEDEDDYDYHHGYADDFYHEYADDYPDPWF